MHLKLIILFIFIVPTCLAQEIIPFPNYYEPGRGKLIIPETITMSAADEEFAALSSVFKSSSEKFCSVKIDKKGRNGFIQLIRSAAVKNMEGYKLSVIPEGIRIEAGSAEGCFYGLQSILQLIMNAGTERMIPYAVIKDEPRFRWRGLMIDESRHFTGVKEVKSLLDMMAFHKLNKFHWHLTNAQGWRIEIKKYPLLTSVGGKGNFSNPDAPAMFYTRNEIKDIINYVDGGSSDEEPGRCGTLLSEKDVRFNTGAWQKGYWMG